MAKKQTSKKAQKPKGGGAELSAGDARDLETILDRLLVQNPNGETLNGYVSTLVQALRDRHGVVGALIERLGRNPTETGFKVFLQLKGLFIDKEFRRTVRKAEYRFEQKGFAAVDGGDGGNRVVLIRKETGVNTAHIVPAQNAFFFVTLLLNDGTVDGPTAVHAVLDVDSLEFEVFVAQVSLKSYRQMLDEADQRFGNRGYQVPFRQAVSLFFDILTHCASGAHSFEAEEARRLLRKYHDPEARHPAHDLFQVEEPPRLEWTDDENTAFLDTCQLSPLRIPTKDIYRFMERLRNTLESGLVLSEDSKRDRMMEICENAADEVFSGDRAFLLGRFFEEEALRLKGMGEDDGAFKAFDIARALRSHTPPSRIRLLPALVFVQLVSFLSGTEDMGGHFKPAQQREEPAPEASTQDDSPAGFHRSASGLILPKGL